MKFLSEIVVIAMSVSAVIVCDHTAAGEPAQRIDFVRHEGSLSISIGGQTVAKYCFQDASISRPYFTHVKTSSGIEVTRRHPPIEGQDLIDHATFHPGLWLAFGDLSGTDCWRLKAHVRHAAFAEEPSSGMGKGSFAARNEYLDPSDPTKVICNETVRYTVLAQPNGYLLLWDSRFSSDQDFHFGDQEEMGLGMRVATPLRVGAAGAGNLPPGSGTMLDSNGHTNERQIWGNTAQWCDYSGTLANKHVGITILCHPANVRPSWFHARDYGLLVANLFGRKSFGKGEVSRIVVRAGEEFRLRYGILVHEEAPDGRANIDTAYEEYVRLNGT